MADASGSPDSRRPMPEALRISPANRDARGPENVIPLSPQWLLPRPGETKPVAGSGEGHSSPVPVSGNNYLKYSATGDEGFDFQKKRDVFRPSLLDMEPGRRDRWRDEERDTNSSIRRDHWRDTDKDPSETRRMERWADHNPSAKNYEMRRPPSDRRNELSHRENYDQRRESKWNTRWGPDDKEGDGAQDKVIDSVRDGDIPGERRSVHITAVKEEKESDTYRPWRMNSSHNRGRGEPLHHQGAVSNKQMPTFSHTRGRGESPSTFSVGRGRSYGTGLKNNSSMQTVGTMIEKGENYPLRYSRAKLLFVYQKTDMKLQHELLNDFIHVTSLTQEEPVDPFALCAPNSDEADVLDGIDKGDIISSGAPQVSKDGSVGRSSADLTYPRRSKLEDAGGCGNTKDEISDDFKATRADFVTGISHARQVCSDVAGPNNMLDESFNRKLASHANGPLSLVSQWPSSSLHNPLLPMDEGSGVVVNDYRQHISLPGWSEPQKNFDKQWDGVVPTPSIINNDAKWQSIDNPSLKRQLSSVVERDHDRISSVVSPENLILYYKDPQHEIQGPFTGSDIIGWFESGYFGLDLQVRTASAPKEAPFLQLGDVMPHLRSKAKAPPGFDAIKQSEVFDHLSKQPITGFANSSSGLVKVETEIGNLKPKSGSSTEAENRFLESLMTGNISNSSQGLHGFNVHSSVGLPTTKVESGSDACLLAKRMVLENQRTLPNPYPFWPVRDTMPMASRPDVSSESLHHLQNFPAQGLAERTASGSHSVTGSWQKYPVPGCLDQVQDKPDFVHMQNVPTQPFLQQRIHHANPNMLTDLLGQSLDNTTNILTPEKLLAAGLTPDPQVLNMLQQQYLLQLQTQASLSAQPMSVLDKLLLLKQQQKLEEQQQLLRQQQLLSQVLSDHRLHTHSLDPSFGQLQTTGVDAVNVSGGSSRFPQPNEGLIDLELSVPKVKDEQFVNMLEQSTPKAGESKVQVFTRSGQMYGVESKQAWETTPQEKVEDAIRKDRGPEVSYVGHHDMSGPGYLNSELIDGHSTQGVVDCMMNVSERAAVGYDKQKPKYSSESESSRYDQVELPTDDIGDCLDKPLFEAQTIEDEQLPVPVVKNVELREKKPSEKKSKKQKNVKPTLSTPKVTPLQPNQLELKEACSTDIKFASSDKTPSKTVKVTAQHSTDGQLSSLSSSNHDSYQAASSWDGHSSKEILEIADAKVDSKHDSVAQVPQCAWKPAPGFRAKSIVEIQLEEQMKTQTEIPVREVSSPINPVVSSPWTGVVASADLKQRNLNDVSGGKLPDLSPSAKKSQLHDFFSEEGLVKSNDGDLPISDSAQVVPLQQLTRSTAEPVDDELFIQAKETKKGRTKSSKSKASASKLSVSPLVDVHVSAVEKKPSRVPGPNADVLPATPSGPSLGDFVVWKGESVSHTPSPAWCSESNKVPKPTSLRDIQKEQEKVSRVQPPIQIPSQKPQISQASRGGGSSWTPASSPSKATAAIPFSSSVSNSKTKVDDELFWGPADQSKHDPKQCEFPDLTSQGSWGSKGTAMKSLASGVLGRQKSANAKQSERSTLPSSVKVKRDSISKHSEAMDFRDWCETECERLIGTKDTSFLQFCLTQSRSEAELFLTENLGSYDPDHEFIDKFLNYKDLLSTDVLEIAFGAHIARKPSGFSGRDISANSAGTDAFDHDNGTADDPSRSGGKKKGKKGKKVNPSVLGFNVVSNRIMMGEIQTIEDY